MGKAEANLLTPAEYARHRGCSRNAVHKAIKEGRISTTPDGLINHVLADIEWSQNTRARAGSTRAPEGAPAAGAVPRAAESRPDDYNTSRGRREAAEAKLAELRLAEQLGELIRVDEVRMAYAKRAAGLREALLQIPARMAAVLAAENDLARCHDLLRDELHQVLAQVTEG